TRWRARGVLTSMTSEPYDLAELREAPFERELLAARLGEAAAALDVSVEVARRMPRAIELITTELQRGDGATLQQRWQRFEAGRWEELRAGTTGRRVSDHLVRGVRLLAMSWSVRPQWPVLWSLSSGHILSWAPQEHPLALASARFEEGMERIGQLNPLARKRAPALAIKLLLRGGYQRLEQITEEDLLGVESRQSSSIDTVDATLCALGVFARSPQRGFSRHRRASRPPTPAEMVARADMPERFRAVTRIYAEQAKLRNGYAHTTTKGRVQTLARFWRFVAERFPEIESAREVRREHGLAFREAMIAESRVNRRVDKDTGTDDRLTPYGTIGDVRIFFHDGCAWSTEEGSPLAGLMPDVPPLKSRDFGGFGGVYARQEARLAARILDLERELPAIRAFALAEWRSAQERLARDPEGHRAIRGEISAFWDWALVELFVQSGLRIEEALELSALDILRRRLPDGRAYYLLHVKPSKHDRARLLPIGDGLGAVLAQIVAHVRAFYRSASVPAIETWDFHENRPRPRAPYLIQGAGQPRGMAPTTVRERLKRVSLVAGAKDSRGEPLYLKPHDGRRIFASEHLNNNTPVHVIAALLGHANLDTVMVYAKLYPRTLVEEYRKAVRGSFLTVHGPESLRNPSAEEWEELSANCEMRDMGTHLCALPTGDHCPRGLVCLGCNHAQPKQSAAPLFARMATSHRRELAKARKRGEPAGQIAARELEVERITSALRRARELTGDVAEAIEAQAR
ncbi:MAG: site-specific integrase, partial [Solirubrobacterales bacterium]